MSNNGVSVMDATDVETEVAPKKKKAELKFEDKFWSDLSSDAERSKFLKAGRGAMTGIVSASIEQEVAAAYDKLANS